MASKLEYRIFYIILPHVLNCIFNLTVMAKTTWYKPTLLHVLLTDGAVLANYFNNKIILNKQLVFVKLLLVNRRFEKKIINHSANSTIYKG